MEHRCFLVFQENAASQLSGYYETSVWDRVVLQACHEEQWARKVVVAIGALHHHRTLSTSPAHGPGEGERERKSHYLFALQQYGTALGQLRTIAGQELQSEPRLRHALIAALLTTCFETYIGDQDGAIAQAKVGIDLLLKWTKQKDPANDSLDEWSRIRRVAARSPYLDEGLLSAFQRLDYHVLLCRGAEPGRYQPQSYPSAHQPFTSVLEACDFWDLVMRRLVHFSSISRATNKPPPKDENTSISRTKGEVHPDALEIEQQRFRIASEQFFRYFDPVFKDSRQRPGTKEYMLANLVMIRALNCRSNLTRRPPESELYADVFLRDFMLMIELARDLIDNANNTPKKAIFNFEITLGISLFHIASACRDPKIRRLAIGLLNQFPNPVAWYDTSVAAKIVTWIVQKEEEVMVNGFVPEIARLKLHKHETAPHKQWANLYLSKHVWKDGIATREMLPPVQIPL
jgi:hypothetical protein